MRTVLFLLLIFFSGPLLAQDTAGPGSVPTDSTVVKSRSVDLEKFQKFSNDEDLKYELPATVAETLWERLMKWIGDFFSSLLNGLVQTSWGNIILYLLGLAVLVGIIMTVLKVDAFRVFYSGSDGKAIRTAGIVDNIHQMDFDELLRSALEKKEFRNGIRLTFLYALKLLSDKQLVDWQPGKTNHDYLNELKQQELRTGFNELSFYFDYTWYGEFVVNETQYLKVAAIFTELKSKVR